MLFRPLGTLNGAATQGAAGIRALAQDQMLAINGDNQNISVAAIIAGIINRTGTSAATADVLPSVDSILAAIPELSIGDSFRFAIRMALAHANTLTLGAGMTAVGTVNVLASNIREYLLTLTSAPKRTRVVSATTTAASAILTNILPVDIVQVGVGMAVTGTGVGAAAKVVAVNIANNTVTVSVVSSASADNIGVTFTPQMDLLGVTTGAI